MIPRKRFLVKSLNEEFQLLRSNAIQRKRFRQDQFKTNGEDDEQDDDRSHLLRDDDEGGVASSTSLRSINSNPPPFVLQAEALAMQLAALQTKVRRLDELHRSHAARPAFDGAPAEQEEISVLTREIGQDVGRCHQQVKDVQGKAEKRRSAGKLEAEMARNMVRAMSNELQSVTELFQQSQNKFLKHLEAREAKSKLYFDDFEEVSINDDLFNSFPTDRKINTQELLQIEENSKFVEQREREINEIVRSICDLNAVFKDLAHMVSEQGSIIDRIDHNIENTQIRVEEGLKQLKIAEKHQQKNRKMHCIVVLAVILVILLFFLIIKIS